MIPAEAYHVDQHAGFGETPDLIGLGAKVLLKNATRLGLTWRLRLATVTESIDANFMEVQLDGDSGTITIVSMIGPVSIGRRVYVVSIPPAGNYAIGGVTWFPQARIATTIRTSSSAGFTGSTTLDTVTGTLVTGFVYKVTWYGKIQSTVADGYARFHLREDSGVGQNFQDIQVPTNIAANQSFPGLLEAEFTAIADGPKTFAVTCLRQAGTGTLSSFAQAVTPTYMYIDYIRDNP